MDETSRTNITDHSPRRATRRDALRRFASFAGASPLFQGTTDAQQETQTTAPEEPGYLSQEPLSGRPRIIRPPEYSDEIMAPVNLHDFEGLARAKISPMAYDYIAAGAADELTKQANSEAFDNYWIRRRAMTDVRQIDTSIELLGERREHPILLGPAGAMHMLHEDPYSTIARAAKNSGAIYVGGAANMAEVTQAGEAPTWWASTLGSPTQETAATFAKNVEDAGGSAICVSVDYPYTGARDRVIRNQFDMGMIPERNYSTSEPPTSGFQSGMIQAYVPNMTWRYMDWVHAATDLPIVVKGIITAEDAHLSVENGAQAVVVSNHGGRTLDGMRGTMEVLPEVVDAVAGRVPVLVDGGVRRGSDVLKALALGARAILIGRPYMWGLGAFGQEGVQRVIELLHGELRIALGNAGQTSVSNLDRSLIRRAWLPREW